MSSDTIQRGVIPAAGVATVNVGGRAAPFTATLASTAAGRQIAFASTSTTTPEPATPDVEATTWINFAFLSPVVLIQFTGNPGDAYEV